MQCTLASGSQRVGHLDSEQVGLIGLDAVREREKRTELSHSVKR